MKTPHQTHSRPDGSSTARLLSAVLPALALGLVLALAGLIWVDSAGVEASSTGGSAASAPAPDTAETCTATGYYNSGYFYPFVQDTYYPVYPYTMFPYTSYPYPTFPYGYPYVGLPGYLGVPFYLGTLVVPPPPPVLPYDGLAYTDVRTVSYPCNAFSNCVPTASGEAVVCPGLPANVALNSSLSSATCGSATNINAVVKGATGLPVADGTTVNFATTLGLIPGESSTTDGIASASLVFPPKTTGTATVTVTSGNAKTTATINVTC